MKPFPVKTCLLLLCVFLWAAMNAHAQTPETAADSTMDSQATATFEYPPDTEFARDDKYIDVGQVIVADPVLIPNPSEPFNVPPDLSIAEQIQLLAGELNRLRTAAARATLIVAADLELAEKENRSGARITVSAGVFPEKEFVSCTTTRMGSCAFVLHPLRDTDPPYIITIEKKKYETARQKIRLDPGAVAMLALRVDMNAADRERRINP